MAATASQTNLAGLPRRLVQDGIVAEDKLVEATEAAKNEKVPLVAYLVNQELADARADQEINAEGRVVATGVIDVKSFLQALIDIDYDGPIRSEPFNQPLRDLICFRNTAVLARSIEST